MNMKKINYFQIHLAIFLLMMVASIQQELMEEQEFIKEEIVNKEMNQNQDDLNAIEESKKELSRIESFTETTQVLHFTTETFIKHKIGFNKTLEKPYLVMFYAPWCGHCKRLIPVWERLAEYQNNTIIAAVDCTANQELQDRFGIKGFPTVLYFKNANQYHYKGERSFLEIEKFLRVGYKQVQSQPIPKKMDVFRDLRLQLTQPSVLIALAVLSIFTILLFVFCIMDYRESQKLNLMEKDLNLQKQIFEQDKKRQAEGKSNTEGLNKVEKERQEEQKIDSSQVGKQKLE